MLKNKFFSNGCLGKTGENIIGGGGAEDVSITISQDV